MVKPFLIFMRIYTKLIKYHSFNWRVGATFMDGDVASVSYVMALSPPRIGNYTEKNRGKYQRSFVSIL